MSTMTKCYIYLRIFIDLVIDFFYGRYWDQHKKEIPKLRKEHAFLTESTVNLARKIKRQELKSEDLVKAVIERIKEVNPILNAVVDQRYDAAIEEAREVDKLVKNGLSDEEARRKPFLGVPFTTKETQGVKGFKYTFGLWPRRKVVCEEDSEAVIRLQEAGAIVLAATNTPEMLVWQETRNPVYGLTNNPHHTGRTTGGSSGGEAALAAVYGTPISLCSDIGGSTRIPAFYCGLSGYHPTANTTNLKGCFNRSGDDKDTMFSLGFLSKHTEDLAPLMNVVAGDKADQLNLDKSVDIKNINFYYTESSHDKLLSPVGLELKGVMKRVVSKLTSVVTSTELSPKPYYHVAFDNMYTLWSYAMTKEPDNYPHIYTNYKYEANGLVELVKKVFGMCNHYIFSVIRLLELQYFPKIDSEWAEKVTASVKGDLFSKLGDNGVLLFPSAPHSAPYHYSILLRPYNFSYWAMINVLKCPAVQVPLGKDEKGMPIGIQVVAAPHNDALCLAVAKHLEKEFGGAVMAC